MVTTSMDPARPGSQDLPFPLGGFLISNSASGNLLRAREDWRQRGVFDIAGIRMIFLISIFITLIFYSGRYVFLFCRENFTQQRGVG